MMNCGEMRGICFCLKRHYVTNINLAPGQSPQKSSCAANSKCQFTQNYPAPNDPRNKT